MEDEMRRFNRKTWKALGIIAGLLGVALLCRKNSVPNEFLNY